MGKVVNWQFGDMLEFKHPICSDCRGNTFAVEISENYDVILHCVKCLNIIDFDLRFSAEFKALEAQLEECRCIKSSYFDNSIKCDQDNKALRARNAELEAEVARLRNALEATILMRRTQLAMTCPGDHDEECSHGEEFDSIIQHINKALEASDED